jgi:NADH-quinone oxidoreductase subunit N
MASFIGIPVTAGFMGKLFIFMDAVEAGLTPLAIVLAVNSILSIYYYLGIAMAAFVHEEPSPDAPVAKVNSGLALTTAICAALVFAGFVFASPIVKVFSDAPQPERFQLRLLEPAAKAGSSQAR